MGLVESATRENQNGMNVIGHRNKFIQYNALMVAGQIEPTIPNQMPKAIQAHLPVGDMAPNRAAP